jgi:hypothetical protein
MFLAASDSLKLAFEQEEQKPHYAPMENDSCLALWVASGVWHNNPQAFNLDNPADVMIWAFVCN